MTLEEKNEALLALDNCRTDEGMIRLPEEPVDTAVFSVLKDAFHAVSVKYNRIKKVFITEDPAGAFHEAKAWLTAQPAEGEAPATGNAPKNPPKEAVVKAIEVKSATLIDQMFCNYKYKHTVGPNTTNTVTTKSEVPVHHDLVNLFRKLDAHLALICEEVDVKMIGPDINDIYHEPTADKIAKFEVTSFAVDGPLEALTFILSGLKELSTGDSIKLETPKIAINADYPFAVELSSTLQDLINEVEQYMQGKQSESPQLEMEFENNNEDSLVELGV